MELLNSFQRKSVTLWRNWNKEDKNFDINHIEDGHVSNNKPIAVSVYKSYEQQKSWDKKEWNKTHRYQYKNYVVTGGYHEFIWYFIVWELFQWGKLRAKFKTIL